MKHKRCQLWTHEMIREEAFKYIRRKDFHDGSCGAYTAALKLGILDEVCQHMKSRTKWTNKLLFEEA